MVSSWHFSLQKYMSLFILMMFVIVNPSCDQSSDTSIDNQTLIINAMDSEYMTKSVQMFDSIYKYFYIPEKDLFLENFPRLENDNEVSWLWPYVCLTAGVNCLLKGGFEDNRLIPIIEGFEKYFDTTAVPGYSSYPFIYGSEEKYYDDNAIVGIELIDAYEITGNEEYLFRAKQAMHIIYTGESKECGGGIYWNETEYGNNGEKGISSNGFGTYLALKLYQTTNDEQYLIFAKRIYSWVLQNLKNPDNQIYWNGILPADCSIRENIWVYNTAIMVLNSLLFYEITGHQKYLDEASKVAKASFTHFTENINGRKAFIYDVPWFKTVLLKSYIALAEFDNQAEKYISVFAEDIELAWKNQRNIFGFIHEDWTGSKPGGDGSLLSQVCIIEIYARLAMHYESKK